MRPSSGSRRRTTFSREVRITSSLAISTSPKRVVSPVSGSKTALSAAAETPSPPEGVTATPRRCTSRDSRWNRNESATPKKSSVANWTTSFDHSWSGVRRKRRCGPPSSSPSVVNRAFPRNCKEPPAASSSSSSAAISESPPSQVSKNRALTPRKRWTPSLRPVASSATTRRSGSPCSSSVNSIARETTSSGSSVVSAASSATRRSNPSRRRRTKNAVKAENAATASTGTSAADARRRNRRNGRALGEGGMTECSPYSGASGDPALSARAL